jgi:hypothetical protein
MLRPLPKGLHPVSPRAPRRELRNPQGEVRNPHTREENPEAQRTAVCPFGGLWSTTLRPKAWSTRPRKARNEA